MSIYKQYTWVANRYEEKESLLSEQTSILLYAEKNRLKAQRFL